MGEFPGNDGNLETTGVSLFFVYYGYHPQIQVHLSPVRGPKDAQAQTLVKSVEELQGVLRSEKAQAQEYQKMMPKR